MFTALAFLVYFGSLALASALLYRFHAQAWYWHMLSLVTALGIGLMPLPWSGGDPAADLMVGFVFSLLFVWGISGLVSSVVTACRHHQLRYR